MSNVQSLLELISALPSWHQAVIWLYLATMLCCVLAWLIKGRLITDIYEGDGYEWWEDDAGRAPAEGPDRRAD